MLKLKRNLVDLLTIFHQYIPEHFFLSLQKKEVNLFAKTMVETRQNIKYCKRCFNISFDDLCFICSNPKRDQKKLCIVAEPRDIFAFERSGEFKGIYHVLGGLISPLDGIHPEVLRINELLKRLQEESVSEVILALNPNIEGDTTILYLKKILEPYNMVVSKLAYGLPMGADIDYTDEITLKKALVGRTSV